MDIGILNRVYFGGLHLSKKRIVELKYVLYGIKNITVRGKILQE